ncbi:GDP-mannose-dependent alpha-mannosyltransferase [Pontiella desulfatans]|uniref:GDP-mannose-dependent alpha-mannosyltransferase n=1 Tax=Pontiella desulfatans TaxID=2750659 RepID=A0A6C2TVW0_PONDE|nr:glycosyltransferase [Pontiella desulfatans]VGO11697.1 GDP-mannose-dependent alpha-mannosyltransferase [Pontiella desulfatans]
MKVCDIVQFYSALSGGVKRYIDDKARYYATQPDIEHVLIVPSHRNAVRTEGCTRIHEVKSLPVIGSKSYRLLLSPLRIKKIIKAEQPNIIEVGDPCQTAWIVQSIAKRLNIPVVAYYHSDYPRAAGRTITKYFGKYIGLVSIQVINSYLLRLYNHMAATIEATRKGRKLLIKLGIKRVIQVPLGTDIERFHPVEQRSGVLNDLGVGEDTKLLLYVGRMAREKNVVPLTEMMKLFAEQDNVVLLMVGDGEQGDLVRLAAWENRNIIWHPYCNSPELLSVFYSAADVFVHPGTNETYGLVSLEAQACGAPVVAVKGGGVDSTLQYDPDAVFAAEATPRALKNAVDEQLKRKEDFEDRHARRERVIRYYGRDTTCGLLVDLYEVVLAEHHGASNEPIETFQALEPTGR